MSGPGLSADATSAARMLVQLVASHAPGMSAVAVTVYVSARAAGANASSAASAARIVHVLRIPSTACPPS